MLLKGGVAGGVPPHKGGRLRPGATGSGHIAVTFDQQIGCCYAYGTSEIERFKRCTAGSFLHDWAEPINRTATQESAGGKPPESNQECPLLVTFV